MPFYTKNAIILPRQARDKHTRYRKSGEKEAFSAGKDGRSCATNTTDALAHGMGYLNSEGARKTQRPLFCANFSLRTILLPRKAFSAGWYLPIGPPPLGNCSSWAMGGNCINWTATYAIDPATNKTCSYPVAGAPPNCSCFEHGNAGAGTGKETPLSAPLCTENASFYQDMLGTNIGKAHKRVAFP
jgi:hypothetical protein